MCRGRTPNPKLTMGPTSIDPTFEVIAQTLNIGNLPLLVLKSELHCNALPHSNVAKGVTPNASPGSSANELGSAGHQPKRAGRVQAVLHD
jgi:hypothetical protein